MVHLFICTLPLLTQDVGMIVVWQSHCGVTVCLNYLVMTVMVVQDWLISQWSWWYHVAWLVLFLMNLT